MRAWWWWWHYDSYWNYHGWRSIWAKEPIIVVILCIITYRWSDDERKSNILLLLLLVERACCDRRHRLLPGNRNKWAEKKPASIGYYRRLASIYLYIYDCYAMQRNDDARKTTPIHLFHLGSRLFDLNMHYTHTHSNLCNIYFYIWITWLFWEWHW